MPTEIVSLELQFLETTPERHSLRNNLHFSCATSFSKFLVAVLFDGATVAQVARLVCDVHHVLVVARRRHRLLRAANVGEPAVEAMPCYGHFEVPAPGRRGGPATRHI
jgi:hypothetical protein